MTQLKTISTPSGFGLLSGVSGSKRPVIHPPHPASPESKTISGQIPSPGSSGILPEQLHSLAVLCDRLSSPDTTSLAALFDLSWGIASLPKEKKFSKKWGAVIGERHWLLLEDISRQLAATFSRYPALDEQENKNAQALLLQFSPCAATLKTAFEALSGIETPSASSPLPPDNPLALPDLETLFNREFDHFVLSQLSHHVDTLLQVMGSKNPVQWLSENPAHIKALFRTVEVIGEAAKILSKETKQLLPTLIIGPANSSADKLKPLWGKLRNQLHHNKSRSWDIATLAPEKWAILFSTLLPKLQKEIKSAGAHASPPQPDKADQEMLEALCTLCGQNHFKEVRAAWRQISKDFKTEPVELKRIVFGLQQICEEDTFDSIWETHAKPFLASGVNAETNRHQILAMLRIAARNLIRETDIDNLKTSNAVTDKKTVVAEMKNLLTAVTINAKENKPLARRFEQLADQFVFLKPEKIKADKKTAATDSSLIQRDAEKNNALKKLISCRISQLTPFPFSLSLFQTSDNSLTESGKQLEAYITLKHHRLTALMAQLDKVLKDIFSDWPDNDITEKDLAGLTAKTASAKAKTDLMALLKTLGNEAPFIETPPEFSLTGFISDMEDKSPQTQNHPVKCLKPLQPGKISHFLKNRETLPATEAGKLIAELNANKHSCLQAVAALKKQLSQLRFDETVIRRHAWKMMETAVTLYESLPSILAKSLTEATETVKKIELIFNHFAFTGTAVFIRELNNAKIPHTVTAESPSLNGLRNKLMATLESRLETDLAAKLDTLAQQAEPLLGISFIQNALRLNTVQTTTLPPGKGEARRHVVLLRDIYHAALDKDSADYTAADLTWQNIERKMACQRLSAETIVEVLTWLPPDDKITAAEGKTAKKTLLDYLNGDKGFELAHLPRFEHGPQKIKTFNSFLDDQCLKVFPELAGKKDDLIACFKQAYGILDTHGKAERFSSLFVRKLAKLGDVFSQIRHLEESNAPPQVQELLIISAEYDMQDIGELAQLITERPSLWNQGRHILSPHHLLWLGLLRKMMAHYPLMLAPHIIRWNLEYLAFDTARIASPETGSTPYSAEPVKRPARRPITGDMLHDKRLDIIDHLDRLNLSPNFSVIYPSFEVTHPPYLHPFGDVTLQVSPNPNQTGKTDFMHAVMELELILTHELNMKVTVIGNWESTMVNIPMERHIPAEYLTLLLASPPPAHRWISTQRAYTIFQHKPWSKVLFTNGTVVTRCDAEVYRELTFFLDILGTTGATLDDFTDQPDLGTRILTTLQRLVPENESDYRDSPLYRWICCLFERLSPPGATPGYAVSLPQSYLPERPFATVIDKNSIGILLLPETIENKEDYEDFDAGWAPYYRQNGYLLERVDLLNGCSALEPFYVPTEEELETVAGYAADVLKAHKSYIKEKLKPENSLARHVFARVESVRVNDPLLVEETAPKTTLSADIGKLIEQEAKKLSEKITVMMANFSAIHGVPFCTAMLQWLAVDKEMEQVARHYYNTHRERLKGPYIQLDEMSRTIFDRRHIIDSKSWNLFPFVTSFRKFIDRIHLESHCFQLIPADPGHYDVTGEFSINFKALVPETESQQAFTLLMKKRELIMRKVTETFATKYPQYSLFYPGEINNKVNPIYDKWSKLFRMIAGPALFDLLQGYLKKPTDKQRKKAVCEAVKKDFEVQYLHPCEERENSNAKADGKEIQLYDPRSYFDGKLDTHQAKEDFKRFMSLSNTSAFKKDFLQEWQTGYGVPFGPLYYNNLIIEAREALMTLTNSNRLPDHNFDDVPTYPDYWTFVSDHKVEMFIISQSTGLMTTLKQLVLENITFDALERDPKKQNALSENPRLRQLINAYMGFYTLENELSDTSYYIKFHGESYLKLIKAREKAVQIQQEKWILAEFDRRIAHARHRLETGWKTFTATLEKIRQTDFFTLLTLWIKWRHFLKNGDKKLSRDACLRQTRDYILDNIATELHPTLKNLNQAGINWTL